MAKATFGWMVDLSGVSAAHKYNVRTVQLGDGYEQRQQKFLRPKLQTWNVQKTGKKALIDEIQAFFDARRGIESFYWQPGGNETLLVKVDEYKVVPKGNNIWEISWTFKEVMA
ncbi:phage tail protein [Neisseria weixii]|uniref:Phage tail protein n=1 Tax=Neisseria weixii TaxID=1853276 RepID=A0A3N4NEG2_9NEIS|nr:phage tail protein [Neisseria weixii]RPD90520.1 phage tail protein [Neisseria weixii]RPD90538.1 phage tail protein [Neisseria weixii]